MSTALWLFWIKYFVIRNNSRIYIVTEHKMYKTNTDLKTILNFTNNIHKDMTSLTEYMTLLTDNKFELRTIITN